jgi:hypothetical protein
MNEKFSWLERGVKERGGFAPSHKFFPLSHKRRTPYQTKELCERGIKGVSTSFN